jgi:histidyl-tRNA synthetase
MVKKEMIEGIEAEAIEKQLFNYGNHYREKLKIRVWLSGRRKGIDELRFICDNVTKLGLSSAILDLDVTLRGIELLHNI